MKLGKTRYLITFSILCLFSSKVISDEKISSVPLVNLEDLKPSYEEVEETLIESDESKDSLLREKEAKVKIRKNKSINIIGLDKITAKTSEINIKLGETKRFGLLEIKALKCGTTKSFNNKDSEAAYIQVKDLSESNEEKVFVFNGWTFSSNPSFRPIDHPVYDLWLIGCENV